MTQWTDATVRRALGWRDGREDVVYRGVTTDSRSAGPGDLFVALPGERFDGHAFLPAVRSAGVTGAVVRAGTAPIDGLRFYQVDDPLRALGWLARARRREIAGPVVGLTGTNGKTSTKELAKAALGTRWRVHATRLNLNNLVGVPLTILEAPPDTDALVIEAGANLVGEIARYRDILEPTAVVITNVAPGHLEGFGSLAGVMEEKLALAAGASLAIVGTEPRSLAAGARRIARRVVTAGLAGADVVPDRVDVRPDGRSRLGIGAIELTLPLLGLHQAGNAMLVWALARELGLDLVQVAQSLERVTLPSGRGELVQSGRMTILNDAYNANPASFLAAIETARSLRAGRRLVFVAGTMRELGAEAPRLHAEIAAALVDLDPEILAAVGDFVPVLEPERARFGDRLVLAPDALTMGSLLGPRLDGTELVVLKASRGVALERILPALLSRTSDPAHA